MTKDTDGGPSSPVGKSKKEDITFKTPQKKSGAKNLISLGTRMEPRLIVLPSAIKMEPWFAILHANTSQKRGNSKSKKERINVEIENNAFMAHTIVTSSTTIGS